MGLRFNPKDPAYRLEPRYPSLGWPTLLRPLSLRQLKDGTGILTCFPSTTAFTLVLGTGLPWED